MKPIKHGLLYFVMSAWGFGICDRTNAAFMDGYLSAGDLTLLFIASGFAVLTILIGVL